jgi:peptide/nickel transport system ATP-binding protein
VADYIAVMLRGWIVEIGPVEKVLGNPVHPYTQILKQSVPQADPDKRWTEKTSLAMLETEEFMRAGCKFAGRCPAVMDICEQSQPENRFVDGRTVKCFLYKDETTA